MVAIRLADLRSPARHGSGKDGRTALTAARAGPVRGGDLVVFCKPVAVAPELVRRVPVAQRCRDRGRAGAAGRRRHLSLGGVAVSGMDPGLERRYPHGPPQGRPGQHGNGSPGPIAGLTGPVVRPEVRSVRSPALALCCPMPGMDPGETRACLAHHLSLPVRRPVLRCNPGPPTGVSHGRSRHRFVRSSLRHGRVICRTVRNADSRQRRSSGYNLSSLPLLPFPSRTRTQEHDLRERGT